jgi:hypothetical protein
MATFEGHQQQQLKFLHASGLLRDEKTASVRAVLLPFWMFDITISSEVRATMGHLADRSADGTCMHWALGTPSHHSLHGWLHGGNGSSDLEPTCLQCCKAVSMRSAATPGCLPFA